MASAIEKALFGDRGTHGIVEFALGPGRVRLKVAPWAEPGNWAVAVFRNAKLISLDAYADAHNELDLPWDVLGFDCYPHQEGRWSFVLHCAAVEWCFESDWPAVEKSSCPRGDSAEQTRQA